MNDRASPSKQEILEAFEKGGAAAAFELLAKMGAAVEQAPEPGVAARVRSGAGTEDAFTSAQYSPVPDRPNDWPADLPFLPNAAASVTRFDRPGRGLAVQWWNVADPAAAMANVVRESVAGGWREQQRPALPDLPGLAGLRFTLLERGGVTRTVMAAGLKATGFVALAERGGHGA